MSDAERHYPTFREAASESLSTFPRGTATALRCALFCVVVIPLTTALISVALLIVRLAISYEATLWGFLGGSIDTGVLERYMTKTQHFPLLAVVTGTVIALASFFLNRSTKPEVES